MYEELPRQRFNAELRAALTHWPHTSSTPLDTNGDGEPEYSIRFASDATNPLEANHVVAAFQERGEEWPRLVMWMSATRDRTKPIRHGEGTFYRVNRTTWRLYVRFDSAMPGYVRYALVETKVIDRDTAPKNVPIPIFTSDSPFGHFFFTYMRKWGNPNPNVPTETVMP
jgi:hypothetical protein